MRARLAFPLTALGLLFLLQGLRVWLGTLAELTADASLFSGPVAWLQMLLLFGALAAPALPLARRLGRERLLAAGIAVAAAARVAMSIPGLQVRAAAAAFVVAGGLTFLSAAVGCLNRRAVIAGTAAALLLEQVVRFGPLESRAVLLPGTVVLLQIVLSAAALALAACWQLAPGRSRRDTADSLERRAGGMRLRGALVLGGVLFLELAVLTGPDAMLHWQYQPIATALVTALAVIVHARVQLPLRGYRRLMVSLAVVLAAAAGLAPLIPDAAGAVLFLVAHGAALLLLAPALTPGAGLRKGWTATVAALVVVALFLVRGPASFAAGTPTPMGDAHAILQLGTGVMIVFSVLLLPRPAAAPPFASRMPALLCALALGVLAVLWT